MPRLRRVQDAQLLHAMAHARRLQLMMLLRKEGPATGSDLARRLGVSSGDTSYHLNVLADYGFIEEDKARNHGRKKFWRARHEGLEWSIDQWLELTPDELRALSDEVMAVLERYADRRQRRDGTERAIVLFHAFPEKRGAT
jgi:DNA-binding transcriptional ArsR family regulator